MNDYVVWFFLEDDRCVDFCLIFEVQGRRMEVVYEIFMYNYINFVGKILRYQCEIVVSRRLFVLFF